MLVFIGSIPVETSLIESCTPATEAGAAVVWITFRPDSRGHARPPQAIRFASPAERDAALDNMREQLSGAPRPGETPPDFDPSAWLEQLSPGERDRILADMGYVQKSAVPMSELLASMPEEARDPLLAELGYTPDRQSGESIAEAGSRPAPGDREQVAEEGIEPTSAPSGSPESERGVPPRDIETSGSPRAPDEQLPEVESKRALGDGDLDPDGSPDDLQPIAGVGAEVFTVCFSGTACTRDEGEESRPESDKAIYSADTGYIPVRIHLEISKDLRARQPSVTVRGVGENDWKDPRDASDPLCYEGPLKAPRNLSEYAKDHSGGNERTSPAQVGGWTAAALALHAANLAVASGASRYNFIGHSRGAVTSIMAAWFIYAYGDPEISRIPVNIFAIDPVPGPGNWYGILTQLPPNVSHYVGVYAWDHCGQTLDKPFMSLVPRPNGRMTGQANDLALTTRAWKSLADGHQLVDPLAPDSARPQPENFELFACRGRHGTVAGNMTSDGQYNPEKCHDSVKPVPQLVYKMARAYLTRWGTTFGVPSAVDENVRDLRRKIHLDHAKFDAMGGGATRTSFLPNRPWVRRVSSISGRNPANSYYLDDVVGDPPYTLCYPVTVDRKNAGWVKWTFL